jgi:hypothetical protein
MTEIKKTKSRRLCYKTKKKKIPRALQKLRNGFALPKISSQFRFRFCFYIFFHGAHHGSPGLDENSVGGKEVTHHFQIVEASGGG